MFMMFYYCLLLLCARWDNGEYERLSPWDMEPISDNSEYCNDVDIMLMSICL